MRQPPGRAAVFSISGKERTAFSFWSAKRICAPILFFLAEKEKNRFKKAFLWVLRNAEEAGGQSRPPLQGAAFLTLSSGEGDADIGALAVDRIDADRALMLLQNLLRDGQA